MTSEICTGTVGPRVHRYVRRRACWGVRCTTMPWWSWRPGPSGSGEPETGGEIALQENVRVGVPMQREPGHVGAPTELSTSDEPQLVAPVTLERLGKALDLLDIRFLADGGGSLLAMW